MERRADTGDAWDRVADQLSALKLQLQADEELSGEDLTSKVGFDKARAVVDEAWMASRRRTSEGRRHGPRTAR